MNTHTRNAVDKAVRFTMIANAVRNAARKVQCEENDSVPMLECYSMREFDDVIECVATMQEQGG